MGDEPDGGLPRVAVVIHTADGRRLKPPCPMCQRTYWGRIGPGEYKPGDRVVHMLPARVNEAPAILEVQLWVCLNCGFLWHRTGSVDLSPVSHEGE